MCWLTDIFIDKKLFTKHLLLFSLFYMNKFLQIRMSLHMQLSFIWYELNPYSKFPVIDTINKLIIT